MGAGNHPRTRKGQGRGPRHRGRGHHGRRHDPPPGRTYHDGGTSAAPPPASAARLPGTHTPNTHRRNKNRTPYGSHQRAPASHRKPHEGWRAHRHRENGPHPQKKPQGTPPRGAPPRPHRQPGRHKAPQAPEEDEGTATAPRARGWGPQRTRDQGTGPPRGGNPTDTYSTHRPERHAQAPTARTQRATHT